MTLRLLWSLILLLEGFKGRLRYTEVLLSMDEGLFNLTIVDLLKQIEKTPRLGPIILRPHPILVPADVDLTRLPLTTGEIGDLILIPP